MKTKYIPFPVGSKVVLGNYSDISFKITEKNVGTILEVVRDEKGIYTYKILLDSGIEIEETMERKYDEKFHYVIEPIQLTFVEEVLEPNKSRVEDFKKILETLDSNIEYLSKIELNIPHEIKEYELKIKEQVEKENEAEVQKIRKRAIGLIEDISICKDKKGAIELLERRHYTTDKLSDILSALNIYADDCITKSELADKLIEYAFK